MASGRGAGARLVVRSALFMSLGLLGIEMPIHAQDDALAAARRAVIERRGAEALELLDSLSADNPDSSEIALWYGHALRSTGRLSEATQQYLRALRLDDQNAGSLIALGDLEEASGNLAAARTRYEAAAAAAPQFPLGFRKAAGIAVRQNRHAEAIALLERYLELRPGDVAAIRVLGMQQYFDEDVVAAQATFERALEVAPDDAEAHFGLGLALADDAPEQDRALLHLRTALEATPANAMALYTVGRILAGRDDFTGAATAFEQSLAIDERQPDAHYRLALAYARLGRRDDAQRHQTRFRELSGQRDAEEEIERRIGLLKEAAALAMADQDLERVREAAEALHQLAPQDLDVLMVRARVELASRDHTAGLKTVAQALALYPDHWEALYLRGMMLAATDDGAAALDSLQAAAGRNPLYAPTHAAIGNLAMAAGDAAAAREAYARAISLEPDVAVHYLNLATALAALGETELEAEALETHRRLLDQR